MTYLPHEHINVDRCRHVNFRNGILKILPQGAVFPKKQKLLTKFPGMLFPAVITPQWLQIAGNSLPILTLYGIPLLSLESIQTLFYDLYAPYKEGPHPQISRDVRNSVSLSCRIIRHNESVAGSQSPSTIESRDTMPHRMQWVKQLV